MKKKEVLSELRTLWPTVQARTRLLSDTFSKLSFLRRRESEPLSSSSSSSSLSSSLNNTNSTMQNCWPACQLDASVSGSMSQTILTPCEFCYEPSDPVILTDIFNVTRERQWSEPVRVPEFLPTELFNSQPLPSQSSGYESGFGNGLSPTTNNWTLGVNDLSSCPSITSDDLINDHDQDRSVFGDSSTTDGPDEQEIEDDSFEVLSFEAPPESTLYIKEFQYTTSNSQNNVCSCCNTAFTANVPARRCHYYGKLYCPRCHNMDQAYIPAKIIKSFNMNLYPVCRRAKSILQLNFYQPIFDIQNDNENLYALVPILSEIKSFRLQFQHFYAYLSTCTRIDNELHEKFFHEFYARDYLYQSVHLYSINDFLSLKKILHTLRRASTRAKEHIYQCLICREKGFTCEICKNRNHILYPFEEMKTIGQCDHCSNIYHKQCWDNIDHDCPKCYRLIQRKQEQNKI